MVYRIYVEKKPGLCHEADALKSELVSIMGINALQNVRIYNRYDVENIEKDLFEYTTNTVFSEPQLDIVTDIYTDDADVVFAVEFLPGQFDQRANSASECIQIISKGERPIVKTAKVYALYGKLTSEDVAKIKGYVINPVEAREAALEAIVRCRRDEAWSGASIDNVISKYGLERRDAALAAKLSLGVLQNSTLCDFYIDFRHG
jgi:phosphoribosylformylglycinamidine synthase